MNNTQRNILVAPLNWGLGHATRCIPIIKELEKNGFNPIIASDGVALSLLKKEFPHLVALVLPSYQIEYSIKAKNLKWKLLKNSPKILLAVFNERKTVANWVSKYNLCGIISDNRMGVYSKKIPSVYITHQLTVLSGKTTWLSSRLHRIFIKNFSECWIPDMKNAINLSGTMGHLRKTTLRIKYIGILSRFEKQNLPKKYNLMILLSGPEPQRTMLEEKLIDELQNYNATTIFIKGKVEKEKKIEVVNNITFYNFMQTDQLEKALNESELVLCRSGYTSIMDLAKLNKKAFFIPTSGQYEQEYLAKRNKRYGFGPYCKIEDFKINKLEEANLYNGFQNVQFPNINWQEIFSVFDKK
jgi:uncharacterized protein (TIGR00661 family)